MDVTRAQVPASAAEWVKLAKRHLAARQIDEAAACYERAVELEPAVWMHWARLGKLHMSMRRFDAAATELSRACALEPGSPQPLVLLAQALREENRMEAALGACERALAIDPDHLHAAFAEALMLPPIYADREDVRGWRRRYASGLERLERRIGQWLGRPQPILDLEWTNFLLAYQGANDVELQKKYSALVASLLGAAAPELQVTPQRTGNRRGKVRVGFVSSYFHACTVGDYFGHWITDLPRERFHVETFYTGHFVDGRTRAIARGSDRFAQLTERCDRAAEAVRDRDLDVVVLPDVGMTSNSVLLANLRLAPVQCAAWGHPVTTGSRYVDYYLSCATMEPVDAPSHYTETLVPLPGIGVRYRPPDAARARKRAELGLREEDRIYLCPHSLYKIHPDNDARVLDIVERDERAAIVFFASQSTGQTQAFARRLSEGLRLRNVPRHQQIKFLPRMSREAFLGVMRTADVMLDTLPWSGGNTTLDALASALPVVTLEGRYMRGRQTSAILRLAGLEDLIAPDPDQQVAMALRVARDEAYRAQLRQRIRASLARVFDRVEPIDALARALESRARPDGR